jgi:hypothetical protein
MADFIWVLNRSFDRKSIAVATIVIVTLVVVTLLHHTNVAGLYSLVCIATQSFE